MNIVVDKLFYMMSDTEQIPASAEGYDPPHSTSDRMSEEEIFKLSRVKYINYMVMVKKMTLDQAWIKYELLHPARYPY